MSTPAQRLREDASNLFDLWSASLLSHRLGTSTQMPKFETQRHKENDLYDLTPPLLPNPTPTPAQKLQAQRLKEEANNLVRQKQYASAVPLYDQGIHLDSTDPLLYGNRALCHLKMKHYLDAASDASDAFKLDPSYIKAYARYAEATDAMFLIQYSEEGYETALKLLDKPKLTPVERKLKEDIERGYDTSKKRIVAVEYAIEESSKEDCSAAPPWRRAFSVIGQMDAHDPKLAGTSASLLLTAFAHYLEATESIQKLCRANYRGRSPIDLLCRALMHDVRVMISVGSIWDETFPGKVLKAINWLNDSQRGWFEYKPNQAFHEKVLKRLAAEGWQKMKFSLILTVQSWIINGAILSCMEPAMAVEQLGRALDVITWGRSTWIDAGVPLEQCGVLFYPRFLLATRKLHMQALMELADKEKNKSKKSKILEELFNEAESVIEFADSQCPDLSEEPKEWEEKESKIVGIKAFEEIPCAVAYFAKGLYYKEKAASSQDLAENAYNSYLKAITLVPDDDEQYARYLNGALDVMLTYGAPVNLLLKTANDLREGMRRMYPVWGLGRDNGESMKHNLVKANMVKGLRAQGRVKNEDHYRYGDDPM